MAGKNPALEVNDIIIGKDRINFRLKQDDNKHQEALTNSRLVQSNDISVQSIKPRSVYTMKVDANPDLINFLRRNQIPFSAAPKTKSDMLAVMARSSILIIYILFLLRMYKTMAGGGGGGDTPGKLARQRQIGNGETTIQFKDIEGIDEAKFEVMELVDSLKNPGKYAILGARAPRGKENMFNPQWRLPDSSIAYFHFCKINRIIARGPAGYWKDYAGSRM